MRRLGCVLYFGVEAIEVHNNALPCSAVFSRGDMHVRIDLPGSADAFKFGHATSEPAGDKPLDPTIALIVGAASSTVKILRVVVNVDVDDDNTDGDDQYHDRIRMEATAAASELVDWVWVDGQTWNPPREKPPRLLATEFVGDINADTMAVATSYSEGSFFVMPPDALLTRDDIARIAGRLTLTAGPSTGHPLLAEAQHYAWKHDQTSADRAVLLAAIGTELRVKAALRSQASSSGSELVEVIIDNPRDVMQAVAGLFHRTMRGVTGRSLKEEDRDLYKKVTQLFTSRNAIAHRGESVSRSDALALVDAAGSAFVWLDSIDPREAAPAQLVELDP